MWNWYEILRVYAVCILLLVLAPIHAICTEQQCATDNRIVTISALLCSCLPADALVLGMRLTFNCWCGDVGNPCCVNGVCCGEGGLISYVTALWSNFIIKLWEDYLL